MPSLNWRDYSQLSTERPIAPRSLSEKTLSRDSEGTRSIGMNLRKYFPGLYWLNYFGSDEVNRVGREQAALRAGSRGLTGGWRDRAHPRVKLLSNGNHRPT